MLLFSHLLTSLFLHFSYVLTFTMPLIFVLTNVVDVIKQILEILLSEKMGH